MWYNIRMLWRCYDHNIIIATARINDCVVVIGDRRIIGDGVETML